MGPIILIHDFNTGIGYNISSHHPGTTCRLFNITLKTWDATDDGSHHIRMKTVQELWERLMGANGSSALVYKGTATVRGMGADIWVGKTNMKRKNVTYQVKTVPLFLEHVVFSVCAKAHLNGFNILTEICSQKLNGCCANVEQVVKMALTACKLFKSKGIAEYYY